MDDIPLCLSCDFYLPPPKGTAEPGVCMRYPPIPLPNNEQARPRVQPTHWCGEFHHTPSETE